VGFWRRLFDFGETKMVANAQHGVNEWFFRSHLRSRALGEIPCARFCKDCPESDYWKLPPELRED
jgi:hypothetical protein